MNIELIRQSPHCFFIIGNAPYAFKLLSVRSSLRVAYEGIGYSAFVLYTENFPVNCGLCKWSTCVWRLAENYQKQFCFQTSPAKSCFCALSVVAHAVDLLKIEGRFFGDVL